MESTRQLIFASSNEHTAIAFKRYIKFKKPNTAEFDLKIIPSASNSCPRGFVIVIKYLKKIALMDLPQTILIVDFASFHEDIDFKKNLEEVLLVYPEVTIWILFPGDTSVEWFQGEKGKCSQYLIKDLKKILSLGNNILTTDPIFDPSGIRSRIKSIKIQKELEPRNKKEPELLGLRKSHSAAAIDEEKDYAYLNGYTAYRLGYSTHLVQYNSKLTELFEEKNPDTLLKFAFDDVFLNFIDKQQYKNKKEGTELNEDLHYSDLSDRDNSFPGLQNIKTRIFVTSGHKHIDPDRIEKNRKYFEKNRLDGNTYKTIFKPSGGIYNLLQKSGLLNKYWKLRKQEWEEANPKKIDSDNSGHSASGVLMSLAERLLDRVRQLRKEANSVPDYIRGALLALEAQELLGFRTPTVSLEAISLRHEFEVLAECNFYGIEYNIDVKNRFQGIHQEVAAVSRWFHPSNRQRSAINAEMSIITCIMRIFNENGQFDEEQCCLRHFRKLNRQWYFLNHPWLNFIRPLRWYIETLIGSFPLFVTALFTWPLIIGSASYLMKSKFGLLGNLFHNHIAHSYINFFALTPSHFPSCPCAHIFSLSLTLLGFMHLGIFISFLYTLISRK